MQNRINASRYASQECCRASNSDIQRAFHFNHSRRIKRFPNSSMGRIGTTSSPRSKPSLAIQCGTECICILVSPWQLMPLAPLGCAVQFHIKSKQRKSWGEHASDGWHLGSSTEHYRCWWVFVKETRSKCITDTIFFKHKYITQPTVTPADAIVKAYQDLTFALQGLKNHKGNAHMEALARVQDALKPRFDQTIDQPVQPDPRVQAKTKQQ
jgi:hypothetical protein